jgi:D-3-phosphoglycerate dehydrogenase
MLKSCYDILENVGDANAKQVSLKFQLLNVLSLHVVVLQTNKIVDAMFI